MFPRVLPRAGCLVLFRILAQFGFTQGGQEYTPKVDWFKLNKYFYKLTTSSQPTATHFLISPEKNNSQILIFSNQNWHFGRKWAIFQWKMDHFHSKMVNFKIKTIILVLKNAISIRIWQFSFENDRFNSKNTFLMEKAPILVDDR